VYESVLVITVELHKLQENKWSKNIKINSIERPARRAGPGGPGFSFTGPVF